MFRKIGIAALSAVLVLGLSSCGGGSDYGEDFDKFNAAIDMDFAKEVMMSVSEFGDDPVMGMRSAGSPAEKQTMEYLKGVMEDIGLQNITVDDITVDGWVFNGANITFKNADGEEQKIDLGGYQTTLQADNEELELVYVNEGTAADYEGLDVKGKLVLLDVDQNENWWINYPAYQAKVKGARAVIAMSVYAEEGNDRVGVQDVCGPADAPALAISEDGCKALQDAIKASGKDSITVTLNADSKVTEDVTSHNLWGEIPGTTEETVFVFSHMDGYFHSTYDDAQGVAVSMAIAKALVDSEYTPDKTIRFCMHGAEEWGVSGSEYDWSAGAYEEIVNVHPDWVDGAFAIVNNDGGYTVEGETCAGTRSAVELMGFVKESIGGLNEESPYNWTYDTNSTGTEDFQWTLMGIPSIVAGSGEGTVYDDKGYHSTYDSTEAQPLNEEGFNDIIKTYGKLVIDLDSKAVRPMSFIDRISSFEESLAEGADFEAVIAEAKDAAAALESKMAEVEESGDKAAAVELNRQTQEIFKTLQDALVGLNFEPENIIRHELYQDNVANLEAGIAALEEGRIQEAYDEYLGSVDWAWYYMNFDKETCEYMENQLFDNRKGTWGDGLIKYRHCDIGDVIISLGDKYDTKGADVSAEIAKLRELKKTQEKYLANTYEEEKAGLEKAIKLMKEYAK